MIYMKMNFFNVAFHMTGNINFSQIKIVLGLEVKFFQQVCEFGDPFFLRSRHRVRIRFLENATYSL